MPKQVTIRRHAPLVGVFLLLTITPPVAAAADAGALTRAMRAMHVLTTCAALPDAPAVALDETSRVAHCRGIARLVERYQRLQAGRIQPFLRPLVPAAAGRELVYPFGGGDLLGALAAFPDVETFTTISLESAGDVRGVFAAGARMTAELAALAANLRRLVAAQHSKTSNLSMGTSFALPGEIGFALFALHAWGFEPVSLRYIDLAPDGSVIHLDEAALAARDAEVVRARLRGRQRAEAFPHVEIGFRRPGEARERIFRHFAFNLDDRSLRRDRRLLAHLQTKGRVLAMTKAASYLLWWDGFSLIRGYLAGAVDFMISDSTGLPPAVASAHALSQTTFGAFAGPFLPSASRKTGAAFAALWRAQPRRPLPFRFGYPDAAGSRHMLITSRRDSASAP